MVKNDIKGNKYGRLTVLQEYEERNYDKRVVWFCRCDCGTIKLVPSKNLINGTIASCGCLRDEATLKRSYKHGACKRKSVNEIYVIWQGIKARCYNEQHVSYSIYGGKGIKMCDRWLDSFSDFESDMGKRPSKIYSVERRESDKDYCLSNCYWATDIEQSRNKKNTIFYELEGVKYSISELAELLGTNRANLYSYMRIKGNSINNAIKFYKNKKNKNVLFKNYSSGLSR